MSIENLDEDAFLRVVQLVTVPGKPAKDGAPARPEKIGLINVSKTSLYRLIAAGKFPKPLRPLPGVVVWRCGTVREWLRSHRQT